MKVLFALGNEQTSKRVAERYYEKFGEELEYKNVWFFKALLEEVKNNKTYDRIVISEELEQFQLKNIDALDNFLFKNVDSVTDEIENSEIIFVCSDRRTKENDKFVEKLFNIGVYNILVGDERNVTSLCEYIKHPMNKKEAKRHFNINPVIGDGEISTSDDEVEEVQIMRIRKFYDNIKGKVDEYLPAFDRIAEQYNRNQLRVILEFLPNDVKNEVLSSPKYIYLVDANVGQDVNWNIKEEKAVIKKTYKKGLFGILKENKEKPRKQPQSIVYENEEENKEQIEAEKALIQREQAELREKTQREALEREQAELKEKAQREALAREQAELKEKAQREALAREQAELKEKAQRAALEREQAELKEKAQREALEIEQAELKEKVQIDSKIRYDEGETSNIQIDIMPSVDSSDNTKISQKEDGTSKNETVVIKPELIKDSYIIKTSEFSKERVDQNIIEPTHLNAQNKENDSLMEERRKLEQEKMALEDERRRLREQSIKLTNEVNKVSQNNSQLYGNVTIDYKKMVVFVGANKSGTTFMVNAISHNIADSKINVGVLDMTRDKSLYYIYNQDDKGLRKIAAECMQKLSEGVDSYIPVMKNLKIYTTIPSAAFESRKTYKNRMIIDTLRNSNNLVMVDADFSTPLEYYEKADEIYIVQDMDILKMQETTLFLRELKNRNIDMNKIKIIINKYVKSMLTPKRIIEGLTYYNDPQMSFVDELLNGKVEHYIVPFNIENYSKYIDGMYKNVLDYKKYTPDFIEAINNISSNVFKRGSTSRKRGLFG